MITTLAMRLGLASLLVLAIGCSDDDNVTVDPPVDDPYLPATSPEAVVTNLKTALVEKDLDGYAACLHEDFQFIPSATDDVFWTALSRSEDLGSTGSMFEAVSTIQVQLDNSGAAPSDHPEYPAEGGYMQIFVPAADIRIETQEGEAGDPLIYLVENDPALFILAPDGEEPDVTWSIINQRDLHSGLLATADKTWTAMKDLYR